MVEPLPLNRAPGAPNEDAVFRAVSLRLLPFLFLLYVVNLIDRTNVGIASLQMVPATPADLGTGPAILSEEAYALGSGIFYVGYLLFEVPSNLLLMRLGARAWLARILISWGLISAAMMFVTGATSFAFFRFLLGFAEAGFFPGVIYYLGDWFPARLRARAVAWFMLGGAVASMVGNPLSGLILQSLDTVGGLWGWQWVFLLEGLPAVALGLLTLRLLPDRPEQAHWLAPAERDWLSEVMRREHDQNAPARRHSLAAAFADVRVWLLIAVYFTVAMGDNSYGFYIPKFLQSQFPDWDALAIGLLAAAPPVIAMAAMLLVGRHSDRTGERRGHVALSALVAALGWAAVALTASGTLDEYGVEARWLFVGAVTVTLAGMKSMLPTFWTLPPLFLRGAAAAGGIALINSVGNVGGLVGPMLVGAIKTATDRYTPAYLVLSAALLLGGLLVLALRSRDRADGNEARASE